MRVSTYRYNYICTHVDNFKIIAKSPEYWLELIKKILVKYVGPPTYYLGNDSRYEEKEKFWISDCTKYSKEAVC